LDGKLVNVEIDIPASKGKNSWQNTTLRTVAILAWKKRLEEMGFIEDCVKAKQEQNVEGSGGGSGGGSGSDSPKCSDTHQVVNDDGTCGDCEEGYVKDIDSDSDTYGECIEAVDNTLLYAGIGGAALLLLIVALK
jgi:hypothetical protein